MSKVESQLIDQLVYARTKAPAFEWPEEARKRKDLYLGSKSYKQADRLAVVRAIIALINNPDSGGLENVS